MKNHFKLCFVASVKEKVAAMKIFFSILRFFRLLIFHLLAIEINVCSLVANEITNKRVKLTQIFASRSALSWKARCTKSNEGALGVGLHCLCSSVDSLLRF